MDEEIENGNELKSQAKTEGTIVETGETPCGQNWEEGSKDIDWSQLCLVRALTDDHQLEIREQNGNKEAYLPNTAETSKGEYPRLTLHWTLNHKVNLPMGDEWMGSPIIIITPAELTVERNGIPENLNAVDTFWAKGIFLPKGSKILFAGEIPKKFQANIDGIEVLSLELDTAMLDQLAQAKQNYDLNYSPENEDFYYQQGRRVEEVLNERLNRQIEEMGYSLFTQDHTGSYMGERNLDLAIALLAKREGIKTSYPHVDTLFGQMEGEFFSGPLETLVNFKENGADRIKGGVESQFSRAMSLANHLINQHGVDTQGEEDLMLIFCAELYKVIKQFPDKIDSEANRSAMKVLFDTHSWIREILAGWVDKDSSESGKRVREILEKV